MADERVEIQIHVNAKDAIDTLQKIEEFVNKLNGTNVNIGVGGNMGGMASAVRSGGSVRSGGGYPRSATDPRFGSMPGGYGTGYNMVMSEFRREEREKQRIREADQKRIAKMEEEREKNARELLWKDEIARQERGEKYERDSANFRQRAYEKLKSQEEAWEKEKAQNALKAAQVRAAYEREEDARINREWQEAQQAFLQKRHRDNLADAQDYQDYLNSYLFKATRSEQIGNLAGNIFSGLGVTSAATSTFASGIGQAFSGMGSMFDFNLLGTAKRYLTAMTTNMAVKNLGSSVQRADILNTFIPYMALAGVDQSTAKNALDRINQSILGLPIGLDEAAQRLRRYQMFMGDTEAATNMTIGIQNAIMAGGASEQMKTQAYYQIDRLLSAGKLSTSRQWLSLLQGLGVSVRFLAEEMGDAGMTAREMAAGLTSGEISTEDFLKAIQRLPANEGISRALDIYKNTYGSWLSNIQFAFTRGNANVLNQLSSSLMTSTGMTNLDYLKSFRGGVNAAYSGAVDWLEANPNVVGGTANSLVGLAGAVGGVDFSRIGTGVFNNIGRLVDYVSTSINRVSGGKLEDFVSFATTLAAPVGGVMKAVGGGLPAMLGVYDRFKDFNFEGLMDNIATATGSMANLVSGILGGVSDETMSRLLAYGLVWGKPVGSALNFLGNGARGIGGALGAITRAMGDSYQAQFNPLGGTQYNSLLSGLFFKNGIYDKTSLLAALKPILGTAGIGVAGAAVAGGLSYLGYRNLQNASDEMYQRVYNQDTTGTIGGLVESAKALNEAINSQREYRGDRYMTVSSTKAGVENLLKQSEANYEETSKARDDYNRQWESTLREYQGALATKNYLQNLIGMDAKGATKERLAALSAAETRVNELHDALYGKEGLGAALHDTNVQMAALEEEAKKYKTQLDALGVKSYKTATPEQQKTIMDAYMENSALWETENADTFAGLAAEWGGTGMMDPIVKSYFDPSKYGTDSIINQRQSHVDAMNAYTSSIDTLFDVIKKGPDDEQTRNLAEYVSTLSSKGLEGAAELEGLARLFEGNEPELAWQAVEAYMAEKEAMQEVEDKSKELTHYSQDVASGQKEVADATMDAAGAMTAAQAASASAKDAIYAAGEASAGATPKVSGLGSAAGDAANQLGAAAGQANALAAAINALPTYKKIIIDIESRQRGAGLSSYQSGLLSGNKPIAVTQSRGGMIYAANGMFIPHGTDTVPAMLTPGEYVVRRKAAQAFGKAFMDRVNALDIHGAFRALSHRMNVPSTGSFIANNQRTYDNHASVTQNIVTNSQSFTHRRARRWVRALT